MYTGYILNRYQEKRLQIKTHETPALGFDNCIETNNIFNFLKVVVKACLLDKKTYTIAYFYISIFFSTSYKMPSMIFKELLGSNMWLRLLLRPNVNVLRTERNYNDLRS